MKHELPAIARHHWIHVAPPCWRSAASACADAPTRIAIEEWLRAGHPLISRARQPGEPRHLHPVGVCLPRSHGTRRVAFAVAADAIEHVGPPVPLRDACAVLAPGAAAVATEIWQGARELGFEARVFGSAAWQLRTGEPYLHAASDLDVLGEPPGAAALHAWLRLLARLDAHSPMRLDGEVQCPGGGAVNWRELARAPAQVLVKDGAGARLEPIAACLARFP